MDMINSNRPAAKLLAAIFLALTICQNAYAQTTPWQETEGGRVRIVGYITEDLKPQTEEKTAKEPNHFYLTGLVDIALKDGWHTYWRNPGSTGMAPEITLEHGEKAEILFPAPKLMMDGKEWTFGYEGHVMLPFAAIVDKEQKTLSGEVTVGLCETICLPQTISFRFDLTKPADILARGQIKTALAALPKPAPQDFDVNVYLASNAGRTDSDAPNLTISHLKSAPAVKEIFLFADTVQFGVARHRSTFDMNDSQIDYYNISVSASGLTNTGFQYTAVLDDGTAIAGKGAIIADKN